MIVLLKIESLRYRCDNTQWKPLNFYQFTVVASANVSQTGSVNMPGFIAGDFQQFGRSSARV